MFLTLLKDHHKLELHVENQKIFNLCFICTKEKSDNI